MGVKENKSEIQISLFFRVQQWAISFGKEIAAMSARYSGAKLLQKVSAHTHRHTQSQRPMHRHKDRQMKSITSCSVSITGPSFWH